MVSSRDLARIGRANSRIEAAVLADLDKAWRAVSGLSTPAATRDALIDIIHTVIARHGQVAASVAAQWFEELIGTPGFIPDLYAPGAWAASVRSELAPIFKHGLTPDALAIARERVQGAVLRHVRNHGRHTIEASTRRTSGVLYQRVLRGPTNCSFCIIMASRGPVYGSAKSAGQGSGAQYHDNCDCLAVPVRGRWVADRSTDRKTRWVGQQVEGADFERLYTEEYLPHVPDGPHSVNDVVNKRYKDKEATQRAAQRAEARAIK